LRALLEWRGDPRQLLRSRRRTVKVHGLLRTGTNYVSALLGENFFVYVLGPEKGGWKHGPVSGDSGVLFVVVMKSPYTWLESFYNWELLRGRTAARTLLEFASAPVSHPQLATAWNARDPIDAWNKATASWVEAQRTQDVLVIRYEDVLSDLARELDRFAQRFSTTRRHRSPVDITSRVGPGLNSVGPVDRGRYTPGAAGRLDDGLVELLDRRVDPELTRLLRYGPQE
jgi:hypothetical protein